MNGPGLVKQALINSPNSRLKRGQETKAGVINATDWNNLNNLLGWPHPLQSCWMGENMRAAIKLIAATLFLSFRARGDDINVLLFPPFQMLIQILIHASHGSKFYIWTWSLSHLAWTVCTLGKPALALKISSILSCKRTGCLDDVAKLRLPTTQARLDQSVTEEVFTYS